MPGSICYNSIPAPVKGAPRLDTPEPWMDTVQRHGWMHVPVRPLGADAGVIRRITSIRRSRFDPMGLLPMREMVQRYPSPPPALWGGASPPIAAPQPSVWSAAWSSANPWDPADPWLGQTDLNPSRMGTPDTWQDAIARGGMWFDFGEQ